jgi:hypothetical protein
LGIGNLWKDDYLEKWLWDFVEMICLACEIWRCRLLSRIFQVTLLADLKRSFRKVLTWRNAQHLHADSILNVCSLSAEECSVT